MYGAVKVNVNDFFSEEPLPNGNTLGIGVVIRNHRGRVLTTYVSSLRIEDRHVARAY